MQPVTVKVCAIAAMAENRVIGRGPEIPWKLPEDMRRFAGLTTGHTVLMGRKTFESLPPRFRPLPGRSNVVATRSPTLLAEYGEDVQSCESAVGFIESVRGGKTALCSPILWIAGGAEIYRVTAPYWDEVFLTLVQGDFEGDAFFPEFEERFSLTESEDHGRFCFRRYKRL